ncbi:MAG: hypothetical protein WDM92_08150 [Caulobacteraceae bacterium]
MEVSITDRGRTCASGRWRRRAGSYNRIRDALKDEPARPSLPALGVMAEELGG